MAATKEVYTASATWTAAQLANIFRDAFIDAGLMTDWHDAFLSASVENRILAIEHGAGTYGTTYYWFKFISNGFWLHYATGWNTTTKQPTGTQYLDFLDQVTNAQSSHWQALSCSAGQSCILTRYTSGIDANQSWFVLQNGSSNALAFTIAHPDAALQSWLDLDRGFFPGFIWANPVVPDQFGLFRFARGPGLRRDIIHGPALRGSVSNIIYNSFMVTQCFLGYMAPGHLLAGDSSNFNIQNPHIVLPVGFTSSNPAYPANSNPVFHSMPYTPYLQDSLPADLGISFHYATNQFNIGDTLVVDAGTEEWEVVSFANNSSAITGASPLFLARVV